ncbi:MAG: aminotransferase class I/II-fold pyridoxal phosphate-dependent enzyme [Hyphomicrobiales bacterium]|nr:aminotransferase class I/II-fold pyridoxal phosphate-dependent enzyme [Hyphomicrobiales bacterium]MBV8427091.1 aminotransferase class I/II-fold pyridoxal phosphate-dependent enzyme [Hyphomicrobiales bacterium]
MALAARTVGATGLSANFFDLPESVLRSRRNSKWNAFGRDILPAFVAEMDFAVAEPIQEVVSRAVAAGDYGYPQHRGGKPEPAVAEAFVARMERRFGWKTDSALVQVVADLVQGTFAPLLAFSEPGDGVILQVPAYPPFHEAIATTKRELTPLTMRDAGTRHVFDVTELDDRIGPRTRILILCNPQNPTGRVFDHAELSALARLAIERDLIVVADEIHSDLVYDGRKHIPFATLGAEIAARTVTITSATKSFNIPGLRCGVMHFGTPELRQRFANTIPARLLGGCSGLGIDATVTAWTSCDDWLDAVVAHLTKARDRLIEVLRAELPQVRCHAPEGTYLAWLDFRELHLPMPAFQFFHDHARVALSPGENFQPGCAQFARLNFATSMPILDRILGRMVDAAKKRT